MGRKKEIMALAVKLFVSDLTYRDLMREYRLLPKKQKREVSQSD